jgi:hypothetical protein
MISKDESAARRRHGDETGGTTICYGDSGTAARRRRTLSLLAARPVRAHFSDFKGNACDYRRQRRGKAKVKGRIKNEGKGKE